jgi:uncharacterized membrane protein
MKSILRSAWSLFIRYLGQGLLFVVPITATIYILYFLFQKVDTLIKLEIPGLGLLIIIFGVTLVGFVGSKLVATPIFTWVTNLLNRVPIIKTIYTSFKDLLAAFVGNRKKFNRPVMVKLMNNSNAHQIGFLTQTDLRDLGIGPDLVSVYVPFSYSIAGYVYIVPKENIIELSASPSDTMKFVISGSVSNVRELHEEPEI